MAYGNGTNTPYGFKPSQYIDGSIYNGQASPYLIRSGYATSIFKGDLVVLSSTGTIQQAPSAPPGANTVIGVFNGCKYIDTTGVEQFSPYWPANTVTMGNTYAVGYVYDDPWILFDVQASNTQNVAQDQTHVSVQQTFATPTQFFLNANMGLGNAGGSTFNPTSGNTSTGISAMYLDVDSINGGGGKDGTAAGNQLKIIRFVPVPGNITGVLFNSVLVALNNHALKGGTGTVGV